MPVKDGGMKGKRLVLWRNVSEVSAIISHWVIRKLRTSKKPRFQQQKLSRDFVIKLRQFVVLSVLGALGG
jgi:hypothetical protein